MNINYTKMPFCKSHWETCSNIAILYCMIIASFVASCMMSVMYVNHRMTVQNTTTGNNYNMGDIISRIRRQAPATSTPAAIHFHLDPARHGSQYTGNPMISVNASQSTNLVYNTWKIANWVQPSANNVFHYNNNTGMLVVKEAGLYLIYAQMLYHDLTGRWSFGIYVDNAETIKCMQTVHLTSWDLRILHPRSHNIYVQCNTASTIYLSALQSINIRCMYGSRTVLTQPEFTFWGVTKL